MQNLLLLWDTVFLRQHQQFKQVGAVTLLPDSSAKPGKKQGWVNVISLPVVKFCAQCYETTPVKCCRGDQWAFFSKIILIY